MKHGLVSWHQRAWHVRYWLYRSVAMKQELTFITAHHTATQLKQGLRD